MLRSYEFTYRPRRHPEYEERRGWILAHSWADAQRRLITLRRWRLLKGMTVTRIGMVDGYSPRLKKRKGKPWPRNS
jgi:hypothetical protein